jgi:general secretion pathway protein K
VANRLGEPGNSRFRSGHGLRGLPSCRVASKRDGFALVAVIWSLGLIALLGMAVMVGARYRTRVATNYTSVAAAEATAESAINLAIATALPGSIGPHVKFPLRCMMPGGERVRVIIEEETGKIDLNTTSHSTLNRFFTALTRDQSLGARIAGRIVELRNPKTTDSNAGATNAPSGPRFATIMQLDQIDGLSPRLFRSALRLVTVRSGRPEPDLDAASPVLRQLLSLEQKPISPARGLPAGGSITIRADVRSPDGTRFIREALVSLAAGGKPFLVHEWRHGDLDPTTVTASAVRAYMQDSDRGCFRTMNAVAS